jgi:hypothetical protein
MEDYARTHEEVDNFAQQLMAISNETGACAVCCSFVRIVTTAYIRVGLYVIVIVIVFVMLL